MNTLGTHYQVAGWDVDVVPEQARHAALRPY